MTKDPVIPTRDTSARSAAAASRRRAATGLLLPFVLAAGCAAVAPGTVAPPAPQTSWTPPPSLAAAAPPAVSELAPLPAPLASRRGDRSRPAQTAPRRGPPGTTPRPRPHGTAPSMAPGGRPSTGRSRPRARTTRTATGPRPTAPARGCRICSSTSAGARAMSRPRGRRWWRLTGRTAPPSTTACSPSRWPSSPTRARPRSSRRTAPRSPTPRAASPRPRRGTSWAWRPSPTSCRRARRSPRCGSRCRPRRAGPHHARRARARDGLPGAHAAGDRGRQRRDRRRWTPRSAVGTTLIERAVAARPELQAARARAQANWPPRRGPRDRSCALAVARRLRRPQLDRRRGRPRRPPLRGHLPRHPALRRLLAPQRRARGRGAGRGGGGARPRLGAGRHLRGLRGAQRLPDRHRARGHQRRPARERDASPSVWRRGATGRAWAPCSTCSPPSARWPRRGRQEIRARLDWFTALARLAHDIGSLDPRAAGILEAQE